MIDLETMRGLCAIPTAGLRGLIVATDVLDGLRRDIPQFEGELPRWDGIPVKHGKYLPKGTWVEEFEDYATVHLASGKAYRIPRGFLARIFAPESY
jgi:hypothetical protein